MSRTALKFLIVATLLAVGVSDAAARRKDNGQEKKGDDVLGGYEVRYEEVSSNCSQTSIALGRGAIDITRKKKQLVVDIQRFPLMYGTPGKGGKVRASSKVASSSIEGVDVKVSVAGRVDEGLISLVFVAEYYVDGKPMCSQAWNVSGQKKKATAASTIEIEAPRPAAAPRAEQVSDSEGRVLPHRARRHRAS